MTTTDTQTAGRADSPPPARQPCPARCELHPTDVSVDELVRVACQLHEGHQQGGTALHRLHCATVPVVTSPAGGARYALVVWSTYRSVTPADLSHMTALVTPVHERD